MIASFRELTDTLRKIDRDLLRYTLRQLDPDLRKQCEASDEEFRQVGSYASCRESLERQIGQEFKRLLLRSDNTVYISRDAANNIHTHASEGLEANVLDNGISVLGRLKKIVVRHNQEMMLQLMDSCLCVLPDYLSFVSDSKESRIAFSQGDDNDGREGYAKNVLGALANVDPDSITDYLDASGKVIFEHGDLRNGIAMMRKLNGRLLELCITPTIDAGVAAKVVAQDHRIRDYAMLMLQMEEMGMRLAYLQRECKHIVASVCGDDLFADLSGGIAVLEGMRSKVGARGKDSSAVLDMLADKGQGLARILIEEAMRGPRHLDLAKGYADIFAAEIKGRVFKKDITIPKFQEQQGYIIATDPRSLLFIDKKQLSAFGFTEDELSAMPDRNFAVVSTYRVYPVPLVKYSSIGALPADSEIYRGKLYKGEMLRVLDLGDRGSLPRAIGAVEWNGVSDLKKLQDVLDNMDLPNGSGQVRMWSDVWFTKDFKYRKSVLRHIDTPAGTVPAYEHSPVGVDSGIHRSMQRWAIDNQDTGIVQKVQLVSRIEAWNSRHGQV